MLQAAARAKVHITKRRAQICGDALCPARLDSCITTDTLCKHLYWLVVVAVERKAAESI